MGIAPSRRVADCGRAEMTVRCRCDVRTVKVWCGQRWLCGACGARRGRKDYARILRAMARAEREARAKWAAAGRQPGALPRVVMLTLTIRHTGDVAADMQALTKAWHRLARWLQHQVGGAFPFVRVFEATAGRDGLGHPHYHVAALLPHWNWKAMHVFWRNLMRDPAATIDVQTSKRGKTAKDAAYYVSKYASKGMDWGDFSPELAARVVDAAYGRRALTASEGFWLADEPGCKLCGEKHRLAPGQLQSLAKGRPYYAPPPRPPDDGLDAYEDGDWGWPSWLDYRPPGAPPLDRW